MQTALGEPSFMRYTRELRRRDSYWRDTHETILRNREKFSSIIPVPVQPEWLDELIQVHTGLYSQNLVDGNCGVCWQAAVICAGGFLGREDMLSKDIHVWQQRQEFINLIKGRFATGPIDELQKKLYRYKNLVCRDSTMLLEMIARLNGRNRGLAVSLIQDFSQYGEITHWFYCPFTFYADEEELIENMSKGVSVNKIAVMNKNNQHKKRWAILMGDTATLGLLHESIGILVSFDELAREVIRTKDSICQTKANSIAESLGLNDKFPRENTSIIIFK
jgi:hypothetical protein